MHTSNIVLDRSPSLVIESKATRYIFFSAAVLIPVLFFGFCLYLCFFNPTFLEQVILQKDNAAGGGIVEKATVGVLLVGICYGIGALLIYGRNFPGKLLVAWTVCWTLACIYFAGEEASWGQWQFGWETPETFQEINKQQETNLHNTSSWLNQKPRTLVELWMILAGLILPFFYTKVRNILPFLSRWGRWLYPGFFGISAVVCFGFSKLIDWAGIESLASLGNTELRELFIAFFLSLYLVWLYFAVKRSSPEDDQLPG
ncbi:MAG: hypothetical protein P1V20_18065 [Verrucomicrobiales bacterium]|nr:hypothetical protein [Verrucomicrobiales bacterium]